MSANWLWLLGLVYCSIPYQATGIVFKNNRYEDILVAIHDDIKQEPRILVELMAMFRSGSAILYKTTNQRATFGHVKILVPHSWTRDPGWSAAGTETFEDSDIRVDRGHVSHGSDPYTFHPGQCGESGRYIHLTDQYLTDRSEHRDRDYGDTGSTLVHEFAHLRYGVFDEYGLGTEEHPFVYLHEDRWLPTGCSSSNIIRSSSNSGLGSGVFVGDCQNRVMKDMPGPDCFYTPHRNSSASSIMYHPAGGKIHFCESDPSDPDYLHNALAPNQHNKMCGGRGTWDVIMEHPDFLTLNTSVDIASVAPTFSVLYRETDAREVVYNSTTPESTTETMGEISVDSTANEDVTFQFSVSAYKHCEVCLESPDGMRYNKFTVFANGDLGFIFNTAKVGTWTYTVTCPRPEIVSVVVKSRSTHRNVIQVESWLSGKVYDVTEGDKPIVAYVHVYRGYSPVIDADVTINVERPAPVSSVTLTPRDDGLLPDNMANDGVYSAYFTQIHGDGRHLFSVNVENSPETKYFTKGPALYGGSISRFHNTTKPPVLVSAPNFTRTSSPGALDVKNFTQGKDNFSPNRVTDLGVSNVNMTERLVTLTWTAPGDDLDQGNASRYDFRICQSARNLSQAFNNCTKVARNNTVKGSLTPSPAGSEERMTIRVEANWTSVVLVMRTMDEAGHWSETSNPVVASFKWVTIMGYSSTTTDTSATTAVSQPTNPTTTFTATTSTNPDKTATDSTISTALHAATATSTTTNPTATIAFTSTTSNKALPADSIAPSTSTPSTSAAKISSKTPSIKTTTATQSITTSTTKSTFITTQNTNETDSTDDMKPTATSNSTTTSPGSLLSASEKRTIFIASTVSGVAGLAILTTLMVLIIQRRSNNMTTKQILEVREEGNYSHNPIRVEHVKDSKGSKYQAQSGQFVI